MLLPAERLGIVDKVPASQLRLEYIYMSAGQWMLEYVVTGSAVGNSR